MLEFYESDSSVEADEDTDVEGGDDAGDKPRSWWRREATTADQVGSGEAIDFSCCC
jgi:hypothetical protein